MAFDSIHVDDFGWVCKLCVVQDGVAQDISSYTTLQFIFRKPDGTEVEKEAAFDSDGTDGCLVYTVEDGLINVAKTWRVRAYLAKAGAELTSDPVSFSVLERGRS